MLRPSDVHDIDRWLSRVPSGWARPLVTLNYRPGALPDGSARRLSDYLSTLDDEPDGWRSFETEELLELVTFPMQATGGKALAPAGGCDGCSCPGDDCATRRKYKAAMALVRQMARRGGAVVAIPGACRATRDFSHTFHVWFECCREHRLRRLARWKSLSPAEADECLEKTAQQHEDWLNSVFGPRGEGCGIHCHLTLNIDQLGGGPLIEIAGDTVLEWLAARERAGRSARDPRRNPQPLPGSPASRVIPFPKP